MHLTVGQAHRFGHEGAWFVTVPGSGAGIRSGEDSDSEPVVNAEEAAELEACLAGRRNRPT